MTLRPVPFRPPRPRPRTGGVNAGQRAVEITSSRPRRHRFLARSRGPLAQERDPRLDARRAVAARHLRHESRRPGRVPRALPADRHEPPRRPGLRAPPAARQGDGHVHGDRQLLPWQRRPLGRRPLDAHRPHRGQRQRPQAALSLDGRRRLAPPRAQSPGVARRQPQGLDLLRRESGARPSGPEAAASPGASHTPILAPRGFLAVRRGASRVTSSSSADRAPGSPARSRHPARW